MSLGNTSVSFAFFSPLFMSHTRHTLSSVLSPALAAAAFTVLLTGCTASSTVDTNQNSSVSMDDDTSSTAMMDDGTTSADATSSVQADASTGTYANGTYDATGNYRSPAGMEAVEVSLTLKDGIVTDATVKGDATNPKSITMQGKFVAGFKQEVFGKSIDSLSLGVVNGSSLTPVGFMDAVAKIKAEAAKAS